VIVGETVSSTSELLHKSTNSTEHTMFLPDQMMAVDHIVPLLFWTVPVFYFYNIPNIIYNIIEMHIHFIKQDLNKSFSLPNVVAQGVTFYFSRQNKMAAKAANELEIVGGVG
jgi:hypothetical protein